MRNLLLIFLLLISYNNFAQKWVVEHLKETKKTNKPTFFEKQKAFYDYLLSIDAKRGYYLDENGDKKKVSGYKQFKRYEYIWENRVNPKTGLLPDIGKYVFRNSHRAVSGNLRWESVGEKETSGGYQGIGRVNCVSFHPTDENILFIGTPAGGFWKSADGGENWITTTDNLASIGVSDIIVHPEYNTNKTIFIATGDRDAEDTPSIGILKSTDEGESWTKTGLSFNTSDEEYVLKLKQSPDNPDELYACTTKGLYKTDDAGESWTKLSSNIYKDLEFKPNDSNVIYASNNNGKIYKSTNKGQTFDVKLNTYGTNTRLAVTAANPEFVYLIAGNGQRGLKGVYKSEDGGENFTQITDGNEKGKQLLNWDCRGSNGNYGQVEYDLAFAVSPLDENLLFVGGINTWRSEDGGENWDCVNMWDGSCGIQAVHADKHVFEFRPNSSILYEGNDGGIYVTNDRGDNWTDLSNTLVIGQIYKLGVDQNNIGDCINGLQDNGSKLRESSEWRDILGGDGMECLIDYENSDIQYAESQEGNIYRTENKWRSKTFISPKRDAGPWVTLYEIDPKDSKTLYACFSGGLYRSDNRGGSWDRILKTSTSFNSKSSPKAIAIAPSDNKILYVVAKGHLKKTIDRGETWTDVNIPSSIASSYIKYIAIKHDDPNTLWLATTYYNAQSAYESTDGGETWTDISKGIPEIPVNTIAQYKRNTDENELYAGTDFGVYRKIGKGDWHHYSQGLPNTRVTEIEFYYDKSNPLSDKLYAATYGRGLWKIDMKEKPENYLSINKDKMKFTDKGGTIKLNIASNGAWTISNPTDWVTVSTTSGINDMNIDITCASNTNGTKRTGAITITNDNGLFAQIDIDQSNDNIILSLNPSSKTVSSESGSVEFDIQCNHSFSLSEESDWLYLRSSTGSGNDKGRIRCYENTTSEPRTAEITVKSGENVKTFLLTQEAPSGVDNLDQIESYISPNPTNDFIRVNYNGEIKSISITDINGRLIHLIENPSKNNPISVKDWSIGPYIINIETEETTIRETVIVTN